MKMLLDKHFWQLSVIAAIISGSFGSHRLMDDWVGKYPHTTSTIDEGEAIEISCLTQNSMLFYYPSENILNEPSNFTISEEKKDSGFTLHTFRRPIAVLADAGFYGCVEVNNTNISSVDLNGITLIPKPSNLTYFFVRSKEKAFYPDFKIVVLFFVDESYAYIPCRPTSPDIHVQLELHQNGSRKVITGDERVTWYPEFGFEIQNVRSGRDDGLYICQTNHNGHSQEITTFFRILREHPWNETHIIEDGEPIVRGMTKEFSCMILKTDIKNYALNWITPQGIKKDDRITFQSSKKSLEGNYTTMTSLMTITNFTENDEGVYKCNFVDLDHPLKEPVMKSSQESFKIYRPELRILGVNPLRADKEFVRYLGEDLSIYVEVEAYPKPEIYWTNPKGEKFQVPEEYQFHQRLTFLVIQKIGFNHAGVYSLHVSHEEETKTLNFTLIVESV